MFCRQILRIVPVASACLLCSGLLASTTFGQARSATDGAPAAADNCTRFLETQDAKSVEACKAQLDQAEAAPPTEHMARIVAKDEYGIALLASAHEPAQALQLFNSEIAMLPASTVKPDSLQWAAAFWHRATAYQQLGQDERAAGDLGTAEDTLQKAAVAAAGDPAKQEHFEELRHRVLAQHSAVLEHQGKHAEAQRILGAR